MVGANGTDNIDYGAPVANRLKPQATAVGAFAGGRAHPSPFGDFERSYDAINGASTASTGSSYTVNDGDALRSIAQSLWAMRRSDI